MFFGENEKRKRREKSRANGWLSDKCVLTAWRVNVQMCQNFKKQSEYDKLFCSELLLKVYMHEF